METKKKVTTKKTAMPRAAKATKATKASKASKASIGQEMIRDLKELNRVVASGESVIDRYTCSRVVLKLNPRQYDPEMVREVRESLQMSQAVFAQFLGVSPSTVRAWEQGQNPVPAIAGRFLDELIRNPEYWRGRLQESVVQKELVAS
jgi:putative transcriptional regulator